MVKFLLLAYPFALFSKMTMKKFFLNRPIQMNCRTSATISRKIKLLQGMIISLCGHQKVCWSFCLTQLCQSKLIFFEQKVFFLINLKWQSSLTCLLQYWGAWYRSYRPTVEPTISNSVNSKSPLFRRKIEFPWIYPYVFSHLLSAISNSVISNSPLFRTHRSFPTS